MLKIYKTKNSLFLINKTNKMKNKLTKYLQKTMEVLGFLTTVITFLLNDIKKLYDLTMIQYIIEHWNWWLIALLVAIFIRLFRLTIREDIKTTQSELIKSTQDLQGILLPDLAINNIFIREILIKKYKEEKLYKLLEEAVFENQKINIPQLERFGIEEKHIKRLKKKYHEIETKKLD